MGQVVDIEVDDMIMGTVSDSVYLVNYDEDQWMRYTDAQKQHCMDTWIKKAEPLGVKRVLVKIHPDILFPSYGKTRPYIDRQHRFPDTEKGWEFSRTLNIQTNTDQVALSEEDLKGIKLYYDNADRIVVKNCNGTILWDQ